MIALGKWRCTVDTIYYSGPVIIDVYNNNGAYDYNIFADGMDTPELKILSLSESENTIDATLEACALPGIKLTLHAEFTDDAFTGYIKVPLFGKFTVKDGQRII